MDRIDAVDAAGADRRQDRDPLPLQHVPADRDRRPGVQVRRRVRDRLERRRARARGDARDVTHAIVLIQAERSALATLGGELADIEGVAEAYSVTGEWDFVAILRLREPTTSSRRWSPAGSRSSRVGARTRRWWRSRSTRATTSRRCSRSGSDGRDGSDGRVRRRRPGRLASARRARARTRRPSRRRCTPRPPRGPRVAEPRAERGVAEQAVDRVRERVASPGGTTRPVSPSRTRPPATAPTASSRSPAAPGASPRCRRAPTARGSAGSGPTAGPRSSAAA